MEIIQCKDLIFRYATASMDSLKKVSCSIQKGSFTLLCGASGSGKTTFLRSLKPQLAPAGELSGEIFFQGKSLHSLSLAESAAEIGFVQQDPAQQIVTDKVWRELAFGMESLGVQPSVIRRRTAEIACFFGIEEWIHKETCLLSGGQMQLLNLASVMVMEPSLLLLDEPTAQLDPIAAASFLDRLFKIHRELGTTIVISEHRLEETFSRADQVIAMEEGMVRFCGTPEKTAAFLMCSGASVQELPVAAQAASCIDYQGDCPLTVREGKRLLCSLFAENGEKRLTSIKKTENQHASEAAVALSHCYFRYEKAGEDVLKDCSFSLPKGKLTCIVGGNGVGKSTVLQLMGGRLKPYRGKVKRFVQRVSVLPQNPQLLFTEPSVIEELLVCSKTEAEQMLSFLGLCSLREQHPYDLSGGEQQRLALGKVLLKHPQVVLLDEPTKGLDCAWKKSIGCLLRTLVDRGITVAVVSHDIEFSAEFADCVAMLFDGSVLCQGCPHELFLQNQFYTTAAHRMAKDVFPTALTIEEVICQCRESLSQREEVLQ